MNYRIVGAMLIIVSCAGFGYMLAANHRKEERTLRQLVASLDLMECELQYHLTPLPELCRQAGKESTGVIRSVFLELANELEDQISPDVTSCMLASLGKVKDIPKISYQCLNALGHSLGRFDLSGQLRGLEAVRARCRKELDALSKDADVRLRSYQTLGLCAGAALAILFV